MIDAPTACFRPANLVTIRGTRDRSRFPEGYSVVVGPRLAKQMGIGRWAVLAFEHPALAEVRDGLNFCNPYIAVHCQVVKDARLDAEEAVIEVDQTLRNALGIPLRIFRDLGSMPVFLLPARRTFGTGWVWGRRDCSASDSSSSAASPPVCRISKKAMCGRRSTPAKPWAPRISTRSRSNAASP